LTRSILLATAAVVLGAASAHAQSLTYQTIDNPAGPAFNQLLGINNTGTIAGYYGSGAAGQPNQGFSTKAPYAAFSSVNVPQSAQTQVTGLNNVGLSCGFFSNTNLGSGDANYGFIRTPARNHYEYLLVNDPAGTANPPVTQVLGVDNAGLAVGFYNDAAGNAHGFELSLRTGGFTPVTVAGTTSVAATAVNRTNLVAGFGVDLKGHTFGFEKQVSGHTAAVRFSAPGSTFTQFLGINDSGVAVGFYNDAAGLSHGLIYTTAGTFTQVDAPTGAKGTALNGVNDAGQAVGFYTDANSVVHGLLVGGVPKQ